MDGKDWKLLSAEALASQQPDTFHIPTRTRRESLTIGDGAKLLFDVDTEQDRGVHRMWVIVKATVESGYVGVLDSDPGVDYLSLREGDGVIFGPEHVADITRPPRDYIVKKYGAAFFPN
jgi:hypothetical protein